MSSNTKAFEEKMKSSVEHLSRELAAVRAGRANPAVLDKVVVDYYGAPTPIQQLAAVAVSEARTLTITPWDRTLLRPISKAIMASDVGITPIDDGVTIRLNFPAPNEERRKQLAKEVSKLGEDAKVAVRNVRRDAMDKAKAMKKAGELTEDALQQGLHIVDYNLRTTRYPLKETRIPSFQGSVTVEAHLAPPLLELWNALLSFAPYGGVGIKTTLGMGGTVCSIGRTGAP